MTGDRMKRILASAALLALWLPAYADDARIAITTASGQSAPVTLTAPVCGVDSSGAPVICGGGGSGNLAYKDASGQYQTILPVVPVCSVTADGIPQTCNFSSGTTDLSAYLTKTDAASTYATIAAMNAMIPLAQKGAASGVATLDANGFSTAPVNTTGNSVFGGDISISNGKAITFHGPDGTTAASPYVYGNSDGSLVVSAPVNAPTITASASAFVPDTSASDSTTAALNTESAAARFVSNSTRGSVTGDISASGSSLTATLGTSGLQFVMSYSAAGTGSLSAVSTSGSLTPVDIYETAAWGTTSFKGYVLDSGTITTAPTVIDSTFYLTSNAWGTYHVGVGGHLYVVDIFGSGAGKRTVMAWRKES